MCAVASKISATNEKGENTWASRLRAGTSGRTLLAALLFTLAYVSATAQNADDDERAAQYLRVLVADDQLLASQLATAQSEAVKVLDRETGVERSRPALAAAREIRDWLQIATLTAERQPESGELIGVSIPIVINLFPDVEVEIEAAAVYLSDDDSITLFGKSDDPESDSTINARIIVAADDRVRGFVDISRDRYELLATSVAPFVAVIQRANADSPDSLGSELDQTSITGTARDGWQSVGRDEALRAWAWAEAYFESQFGDSFGDYIREFYVVELDTNSFIAAYVGDAMTVDLNGMGTEFTTRIRRDRDPQSPGVSWVGVYEGGGESLTLQLEVFYDGRAQGMLSGTRGDWFVKESPEIPYHVIYAFNEENVRISLD